MIDLPPKHIKNIDCKFLENSDTSLTQALLYGNISLDVETNSFILNATIGFKLYFVYWKIRKSPISKKKSKMVSGDCKFLV